MKTRSLEQFSTVRTEGGLLPPDVLKRIADGDVELGGLGASDYHLAGGERLTEAISRSWNRMVGAWQTFRSAAEKLPERDAGTSITRERWLLILFQELGHGRLPAAKATEIEGRAYPISHFWQQVPIHLVGFRVDLDRRTRGVAGAARRSPHSLVQEFLNRSDEHLWGFVSNGHTLRVLRDNASLTRLAYVEFDLEAMMEGEVYSDFVLLWLLCHESRVESEIPDSCWLECWTKVAREQGTRALDALRDGVERAIVALGKGFLAHPGNGDLRGRLRSEALHTQDYYRQLLRLVYRLLFLFVAEDRDLMFMPGAEPQARERYIRFYSTRRLRRIADRRRGSRHADLYRALRLVMGKLGEDAGCPELGLAPLGSFLWSREAVAELAGAEIANGDLLEAIRALAFVQQDKARRSVDYRNLGSAELGSVYESLLELHPTMSVDAASFVLQTASGHERKITGSYYTDDSLVQCLLDSALDPVLDEAATADDPERAILGLKVCDPAVGSGHFLVAAAHRMAKRLAAVRIGEEEPSAEGTRTALRDVLGHCLHGVDVNSMAVELCKLSLWMEALEPGKPLSFLDHKIQCGNSLLGTTPALLAKGIPDSAFKPIEGDDKAVARDLKRRNKEEREGQTMMLLFAEPVARYADLSDRFDELEALPDDTPAGVREKAERYRRLVRSEGYRRSKLVADAWCAAFVWRKTRQKEIALTHDVFLKLANDPGALPVSILEEIGQFARYYGFFHWHLAFPDIFRAEGNGNRVEHEAGWSGGFDVVLGNPPWEKFTVSEEEWFASRHPQIAATKGKSRRGRLVAELAKSDPDLFQAYREAKRDEQFLTSILTRDAATYPLTGFRELNTYHLFAELAERIVSPNGLVGIVVKTGIGSAVNCLPFFKRLTERRQLTSLLDFVNTKKLFPDVQTVERFSLISFSGGKANPDPIRFATLCQDVSDLRDPDRLYTLTPEDITLMSPENGACPLLGRQQDAEILRKIYRRYPVLRDRDSNDSEACWNPVYTAVFHMANDSEHFKRLEEFEGNGIELPSGGPVRMGGDEYLPLYEGKYFFLLEHRYGSFETVPAAKKYARKASAPTPDLDQLQNPHYEIQPRYWFPKTLWLERSAARELRTDFHFLFRDVTGVYPDVRTAIGAICPAGPAGHKAPVLTLQPTGDQLRDVLRLLTFAGLFCSIPFDYCVRNKLYSKSLNLSTLGQIPIPRPAVIVPGSREAGTPRAVLARATLELSYTTHSLRSLGHPLGFGAPFHYAPERRFELLRCIDALAAHFYGLSREEFSYVLPTFKTLARQEVKAVGEFRTERVALNWYDDVQLAIETGGPYRTRLDPPPADPRCCHLESTRPQEFQSAFERPELRKVAEDRK